MARVLVTGGAGYIGTHTVRALEIAGYDVTVLDDLSAGHRSLLPPKTDLHVVDLTDEAATSQAVAATRPQAVVHFAGAIEAGLSMIDPARFYRSNVIGSFHLAQSLRENGNPPVVYSSSAAVYGDPDTVPIPEGAPKRPTSVYGRTKLDTEGLFAAFNTAYGLRATALRYFNAAGAAADTSLGEAHRVETHLVPVALAAASARSTITLYGTDYPTPDGTCIRDYVHVEDLATAHVLALAALLDGAPGEPYNVGVGSGFSNREVLAAVERVTGRRLEVVEAARRPGDPAELVADPARITSALGWRPRWTDLDQIVASAAAWHANQGPTANAAASKKP